MAETDGMQLVEEDSAVLLGRRNKPLNAAHSMMNKFGDPNDANFILVSDEIREMANEAKRITVSQREGILLRKVLECILGLHLRHIIFTTNISWSHGDRILYSQAERKKERNLDKRYVLHSR